MSALSSPTPAPSQPLKPVRVQKPEESPSKSRWAMIIVGVVVLVVAGVYGYQQWAKQVASKSSATLMVKTAKAVVGPLDVRLRMTGQTSARNFVNVTTPLMRGPESRGSMTLLKLVSGGALVKKGQLIVDIDAQSIQDHIDDIRDTVAAAENDIKKRKSEQSVEWETMQQTLRVTKASFEKARFDAKPSEIRTPIERELMKLSVDESDARYKQQVGDVDQRKLSQAAEIKILELTLERHRRHLARHEHDLTAFRIFSPMNGLAVMGSVWRGGDMAQFQEGDQVYPGQPIMKVVDPSSMQVEATVSQADSGELRIGQRVRIGVDAFKDLNLNGRVYSIGALAVGGWRQNNYIRSVPIRVMVEGTDPRLIPDLSAHADVLLETIPSQLQVPISGVTEEGGKATVQVRGGIGWATRGVTLGKRNNTNVAITSGLKAGEEIRLN